MDISIITKVILNKYLKDGKWAPLTVKKIIFKKHIITSFPPDVDVIAPFVFSAVISAPITQSPEAIF